MSSAIMRRLLFSMKKLGPAWRYDGKTRLPRQESCVPRSLEAESAATLWRRGGALSA